MEIALYAVEEVVAGITIWPWEQSQGVLTRYVEWAATAPESVSVSARLLQIPPPPEIPAEIRGRQINFAEWRVSIGDAIGADAFTRLERIKNTIDPDGLFRSGRAFTASAPAAHALAA